MRICLSIFYKHFSTLTPTHVFFAVKVLRTVETNTDKDTINQNKNSLKIYALIGNKKNDLVKYFMQHIRNGLFIDLINT